MSDEWGWTDERITQWQAARKHGDETGDYTDMIAIESGVQASLDAAYYSTGTLDSAVEAARIEGEREGSLGAYKSAAAIIKALFPWLIDADGHAYDPGAEPFVTAARAYVELAEQVIAEEEKAP